MMRAFLMSGLAFFFLMSTDAHADAMDDDGMDDPFAEFTWFEPDVNGAIDGWLWVGPGTDIFPAGLEVGGEPVDAVRIRPNGTVSLDGRVLDQPGPLALEANGRFIAPLWADFAPGACGVESRIGWHYDGALTVRWDSLPLAGCDPDAPVKMGFTMTLSSAPDGTLIVALEYDRLDETGDLDGRAGLVLADVPEAVLELFPDDAPEVPPNRVKALLGSGSDGVRGLWTIEVDAFGRVAGDQDLDGIRDDFDNCPEDANALQIDSDGDEGVAGIQFRGGDACDPDDDNDTRLDVSDNCPLDANWGQSDLDEDGLGDVCDPDIDGDGFLNDDDLCREVAAEAHIDEDGDGLGRLCDADEMAVLLTATRAPIVFDILPFLDWPKFDSRLFE